MTRTIMADLRMPLDFWAETLYAAVPHQEQKIKSMMHEKTPYEVWNCRKPNIRYLRRYGCVVYLLDKEE